jgi:hypothetical protein
MDIIRTRHGLRLSQHGVVVSEVRASAGPTHSVFDVLAALISRFAPGGRIGVLGFAAGGMMAPLAALAWTSPIDAVDLDREAFEIFRVLCPQWVDRVCWHRGDAVVWLRRQRARFPLILEDLSVPVGGDVFKPAICYTELPGLIQRRLQPGGVALSNLLISPGDTWKRALAVVTAGYNVARLIRLDDFQNRLVIAGDALPSARVLGAQIRQSLRHIRSRQTERLRVEDISPGSL